MIYESIFDVIRTISPHSEYIHAYEHHKTTGLFSVKIPADEFQLIELPNGMATALPYLSTPFQYYRGENDVFPTCKSSISRNCKTNDEKILADLKLIEFKLALKQFPQVYLAEKDGMYINYTALAQHYGFDTNYLDLTGDIGVAAFFACAKFNSDGTITSTQNELAQIRAVSLLPPDNPLNPENKLHVFGLQPFLRPSRQCGSCLQLEENEDFSEKSVTYVFKTNPEDSQVIINCFSELHQNRPTEFLWLFPNERIVPVAKEIIMKKCISSEAINLYCSQYRVERTELIQILDNNTYSIIYSPVKWLTDEEKAKFEEELTPYPYGKNKIAARLCYKPITQKEG